MPRGYEIDREIRVAAVARYLAGHSIKDIRAAFPVDACSIVRWVRKADLLPRHKRPRSRQRRMRPVKIAHVIIALAALLAATPCRAQSVNNLSSITKDQFVSVFASVNEARDRVAITAFAPNAPTTQLAIRGDGQLLMICPLTPLIKSCRVEWLRSAMIQRKCVQCAISATAIEPTKTYRANTEIVRP